MSSPFPVALDHQTGTARVLTLGPLRLFFSYATLVAIEGPGLAIRTSERFSVTTAKHVRSMGCGSFALLDPDLFAAGVQAALAGSFAAAAGVRG